MSTPISTYGMIESLAKNVAKDDTKIYLFGSRARGDYREDSDWDLLVLINKNKLDESDYERYFYPFVDLSWETGAAINPQLYTMEDWKTSSFTPFYHNVEHDKICLV